MKLSDLIPLFESAETKKLGQLIAISKKAYQSLPEDAQRAIREWETAMWDEGDLSNAYRNKSELLNVIAKAFQPVKEKMHELFGDTILLHRGQRTLADKGKIRNDTGDFNEKKVLFSFSFDENVAKSFAYGRHQYNVPSEEDIKKAVQQYERTGYVKFGNKHYKRMKDNPKYYGVYNSNRNFITDGDDLEYDLMSNREILLGYQKDNESNGSVKSIEVPIDKIVWLTNNLNSKEFIVALNPLTQ